MDRPGKGWGGDEDDEDDEEEGRAGSTAEGGTWMKDTSGASVM